MTTQPLSKKKKQPSSIWEIQQRIEKYENAVSRPIFETLADYGLDGWTHWPTPMNFAVRVTQLACEPTWQAKIELYATGALWFFWTNLIPSPVEITRKLFLGGYKCGFYLPIRFKSPLNFIIGQGGTTFLAELARPITTFAFWWWVGSSIFSAIDIWTTVAQLEDECHTEGFSVLLRDGAGAFNASGSYQGAGMQVIEDDFLRWEGASGVDVHNTVWTYDIFGRFHTGGNLVDHMDCQIKIGSTIIAEVDFGAQQTTDWVTFNVSAKGSAGPIAVAFAVLHIDGYHQSTAQFGFMEFQRVTANGIPYAP